MTRNGAYVTLLTKTEYLAGALVLHKSLVDAVRGILERHGMVIVEVESLMPREGSHALAAHDIRFQDTWTKLRAFGLAQYERVVMLDCDMIVVRNMDELMDLDLPADWIAAAHVCACNPRRLPHYPADWTPENCAHTSVSWPTAISNPPQITASSPRPYNSLNSGLVVLNPSTHLMDSLAEFLDTDPRIADFSFPDQDLLAAYFAGRWKVLPWCYNALKTLREIHKNLWRDDEVRCVHYILHDKPWSTPRGTAGVYEELNVWWWDRYDRLIEELKVTEPQGWELVDAQVAKP